MISVVVVTRNRKSLLLSCLLALSRQTIQPKEIIVVDNNSTDGTKLVVENFIKDKPFFKYFNCKKIGIPYTRNLGFKKAKYNIIAWLDDDCVPKKSWYEIIERNASLAKNYVLQGGATNPNPENLISTALYFLNQRNLKKALFSSTKNHQGHKVIDFFDTKNFVIHKKHIQKIGHFFKPEHILAGDLFFHKDLKKNNIDILHLENIDVDHYYERTLVGYFNKLRWAKKCKNNFGHSIVQATSKYAYAESFFGKKRLRNIKKKIVKEKLAIEQAFLSETTKSMGPVRKAIFKMMVWSSNKYLDKI